MKKWLLPLSILATLSACSSDNADKQRAQDKFARQERDNSGQSIDIRPPTTPLSIIGGSVAQFDGERASVVYSVDKKEIYNLKQIERLLNEQNIPFKIQEGTIHTDWTSTGRNDEVGELQARYQIEQVSNAEASALVVSILAIKRDGVVFTPSQNDKQRYAADRLNQLIGELNQAYQQQKQQLVSPSTANISIQSQLGQDGNRRTALVMNSDFALAWYKLGQALPALGFEIKEETPGRGIRELKYRPLDKEDWQNWGINQPELESGQYYMQLSAIGQQSAVVITDENGSALKDDAAYAIYQALQLQLIK